jgi:hypothetical protein
MQALNRYTQCPENMCSVRHYDAQINVSWVKFPPCTVCWSNFLYALSVGQISCMHCLLVKFPVCTVCWVRFYSSQCVDTHITRIRHTYTQGRLPTRGVTKAQIDNMLNFSHSLGRNYTGEWLTPSLFRITVANASRNINDTLPHPPTVFGVDTLKVSPRLCVFCVCVCVCVCVCARSNRGRACT